MNEDVAKFIDHTQLRADASEKEIVDLCDEALTYGFASVCLNPCYVFLAARKLQGSAVKVCTVTGFPLGAAATTVKAFETARSIKDGAREVDMVLNIGAIKSGNWHYAEEDIRSVVAVARRSRERIVVKVILETCLLTDEEKKRVLFMLLNTGADFVKTSTGFSDKGAVVEDVRLMKEIVGEKMFVKASGGIRNFAVYKTMREAGADRIGTSSGVKILREARSAAD